MLFILVVVVLLLVFAKEAFGTCSGDCKAGMSILFIIIIINNIIMKVLTVISIYVMTVMLASTLQLLV